MQDPAWLMLQQREVLFVMLELEDDFEFLELSSQFLIHAISLQAGEEKGNGPADKNADMSIIYVDFLQF
jgi:hypothetical protein